VGIYGLGTDGVPTGGTAGGAGGGGSGGQAGTAGTASAGGNGGFPGGGGGGAYGGVVTPGVGATGAVRIVWGAKSYPYNAGPIT